MEKFYSILSQFAKIFNDFFANLSTNLLKELPMPTNLFGIDSVQKYYSRLNLQNKQFFSTTNNQRGYPKVTSGNKLCQRCKY